MTKTFVLGVGAQKSGTSWLHNYLQTHPNVNFGIAKEYHVFDAIYVEQCKGFYNKTVENVQKILEGKPQNKRFSEKNLNLLRFYMDTETYFEYFNYLILSSDTVNVTGDITPSYSALPSEAFAHIRNSLKNRNFSVRVIFLMRDPVDRICSRARHERKMRKRRNHLIEETLNEAIKRIYAGKKTQIRTRYQDTITNLESVFEPDEIFFEFYENLYQKEAIERLDKFIGIPFTEPDFEEKVNESPENEVIEEEIKDRIAVEYKETFAYVQKRFGADYVNRLWPNTKRINSLSE